MHVNGGSLVFYVIICGFFAGLDTILLNLKILNELEEEKEEKEGKET